MKKLFYLLLLISVFLTSLTYADSVKAFNKRASKWSHWDYVRVMDHRKNPYRNKHTKAYTAIYQVSEKNCAYCKKRRLLTKKHNRLEKARDRKERARQKRLKQKRKEWLTKCG